MARRRPIVAGLDIGTQKVAMVIAEHTEVVGAMKIQFTDLSQGAIRNWAWDVDSDGIVDSAEQNPVHTYKKDGSFSVTLTVTGSKDRSSITKEHYINVTGCGG